MTTKAKRNRLIVTLIAFALILTLFGGNAQSRYRVDAVSGGTVFHS